MTITIKIIVGILGDCSLFDLPQETEENFYEIDYLKEIWNECKEVDDPPGLYEQDFSVDFIPCTHGYECGCDGSGAGRGEEESCFGEMKLLKKLEDMVEL